MSTTHRVNFDLQTWKHLFYTRGLNITSLSKINDRTILDPKVTRAEEILKWTGSPGSDKNYVIIDDDTSIHALPELIKQRWVRTSALVGFDNACLQKAMQVLLTGV